MMLSEYVEQSITSDVKSQILNVLKQLTSSDLRLFASNPMNFSDDLLLLDERFDRPLLSLVERLTCMSKEVAYSVQRNR